MAYSLKIFLYHHQLLTDLYNVIRNKNYNKRNKMSEEDFARWFYKRETGRELNLISPKTFDEKIWYLKLYDHDPLKTVCTDKYQVREYVKQCGLESILNHVFGVYERFEAIEFESFSTEVFIKCTHTSGCNVIYDPKKSFDYRYYKNEFNFWLQRNYYWNSREWNYKDVPARIICESVIRDKNGNLPIDYKFFCFGGNVEIVSIDIGVANKDGEHAINYYRNIYNCNFELLPVKETRERYAGNVEKPFNFEKMVEYAEILSKPFRHCRVDFYDVDGQIYFGEMTFYHGSGCNHFEPKEWDERLGELINIEGLR